MRKRVQVSVPLPADLRAFVERVAREEDRSVANTIKHFIAAKARERQAEQAAPQSEAA